MYESSGDVVNPIAHCNPPGSDRGDWVMGGLAGFNHPGREPGRFQEFAFDPRVRGRVVSLELFNRDYWTHSADENLKTAMDKIRATVHAAMA